ncbi:similar to Saccharomyces cerevisiae YDL036C PUS9 Mitochondrial tRNA:pseudouridine synthase, catalyzes the formation of pseudouridine at position 32 in mitochondrial tRNAs [Maudiozyma barnettii]|uniref:tRNA pseudouridine(32) synthase n=1 Tax=Maudiozyma barnettii TaxID=61262 RepID=A0A8H2VKY8_9SACH|nr:uncharacterized protein KABA2_13S05434 [Kazachstania barnettii]CAB4257205.1 similar to Saccharomyces cerevisiae YDL036C PUS9 Mitochondrial tRNA:pseudouridine synthase, catalyzes the formation of pseudouridine at position 32 in mitochondrial tRNAs [Kazachstania barnettii]CAD1779575.1 similar to Saccharomyces cerevisiae YDL036C PUS9 Mitochondrial tRNA:pseudouridine synthase, catalyzes the formation of pseudouridine at position 32 in mitochondrial tRNAs [Kazachstania barnettii]
MSQNEFDVHLEQEIERAKKAIETKKQRRTQDNKISYADQQQLRDHNGFKLKLVGTDASKNKQVDPDYEVIIDGPLRKIKPYFFTYKTFCKERWRDMKLVDIFTSEFRDREPDYYRRTIAKGEVLVNGQVANLDTIVRNGELITHKMHRHEPPVTSKPIGIVFENDDLLVIDKPSSIPVHPTGRFRFNTITKIIEKERGIVVHPCNRLDKPTSGLMFLAKTPHGADDLGDQLKSREVSKEYVARVIGEFPLEEVVVEKPVRSIDPRVALNAVCAMEDKDAKLAKTVFNRISYDGKTSIIKCKPLTGRTHQIRVHLQYIGYPIANDPLYSNLNIWGPQLGKGGATEFDEIAKKLDLIGKTDTAESWFYPNDNGEKLLNKQCEVCEAELYTEPGPNDLNLWLHAYRYESTTRDPTTGKLKWSYRTKFPDWALEPHRKYMELAIKEADKCGPTTTAFSVGAVIVNGPSVLSTGYSREFPGNTHAEQCALEKYFERTGKRTVPPGSIIYTTMEPCSLRLSGNDPCVQRILALDGNISTVFVGVMEPDTFVKNNTSLTLLESHDIDYIQIPGYEAQCTIVAFKGHEEDMEPLTDSK